MEKKTRKQKREERLLGGTRWGGTDRQGPGVGEEWPSPRDMEAGAAPLRSDQKGREGEARGGEGRAETEGDEDRVEEMMGRKGWR